MKPIATTPSLAERVYREIADNIFDGTLPPGKYLRQEQVAAELGVSRQPVQQAMALLKTDGLIEEAGKRGLVVAGLDLARMHHHYAIRAVLDGYAARSAAEAVAAGQHDPVRLRQRTDPLLKAGKAAASGGSLLDQVRLDEDFHKLIYDLSGNPVLAETAEPNWRFLRRAMADVLRYVEPPKKVWKQHRGIVDAILAGDAGLAEERAGEHIRIAAGRLSEALEKSLAAAAGDTVEAG